MAFARDMVSKIEDALLVQGDAGGALTVVSVDGLNVTFGSPTEARSSLENYRRQVGVYSGQRPRVASVKLS